MKKFCRISKNDNVRGYIMEKSVLVIIKITIDQSMYMETEKNEYSAC